MVILYLEKLYAKIIKYWLFKHFFGVHFLQFIICISENVFWGSCELQTDLQIFSQLFLFDNPSFPIFLTYNECFRWSFLSLPPEFLHKRHNFRLFWFPSRCWCLSLIVLSCFKLLSVFFQNMNFIQVFFYNSLIFFI